MHLSNGCMPTVQAVVLATGGFAASRELLQRHNPLAASLATTNGPWALVRGSSRGFWSVREEVLGVPPDVTVVLPGFILVSLLRANHTCVTTRAQGEGLDIASKAGAHLVDLQEVQIHPTGVYYLRAACTAVTLCSITCMRVVLTMPDLIILHCSEGFCQISCRHNVCSASTICWQVAGI